MNYLTLALLIMPGGLPLLIMYVTIRVLVVIYSYPTDLTEESENDEE